MPVASSIAGRILVCWSRWVWANDGWRQSDIYYALDSGPGWTNPRPVDPGHTGFDDAPNLVTTPQGTPYLLWRRSDPLSETTAIYASSYEGFWSVPQRVPTGPGYPSTEYGVPSACAGSSGRVWLTWGQDDSVPSWRRAYAAFLERGVWSPRMLVTRVPGFENNLPGVSIAESPGGLVWAGWTASYHAEDYTVYTAYYDGTTWSEPITCHDTTGGNEGGPLFCADPAGTLWIFWDDWRGGWAARDSGSAWVGQELVDPGGIGPCCCDRHGNVWVVWEEEGQRLISAKYRDAGGRWWPKTYVDSDSIRDIEPSITAHNSKVWAFWVKSFRLPDYTFDIYSSFTDAPGIEEGPRPQAPSLSSQTTVVRGILFVNGLGTQSQSPGRDWVMSLAILLDASGRKVMDLLLGPNDVRHLSPGVYFVRSASGVERHQGRRHEVGPGRVRSPKLEWQRDVSASLN